MPKTITWLASYPESGNTWLRLFLFNYLFNLDEPAPINQAHRIGPSDSTTSLYFKAAGRKFDISDIVQTLRYRTKMIAAHAGNGADVNFMKTHFANTPIENVRTIPPAHTRGALYIIRNPADMLVSFTHHFSTDKRRAVDAINSDSHTISMERSGTVLAQYLGRWSDHVLSWADSPDFHTHVMRYEDMQADPHGTFGAALRYIGVPEDPERLDRAIRFSSFSEVKKQESTHGFVEKPANAPKFFRSGKVGEGRASLPSDLIARIEADHGDVMKRFGYLS